VLEVKGFNDQRRLVLSIADAGGVNLAMVSESSSFFHFKALGIAALFAADLRPGTPGEELGVVMRHEDHDQLAVLGLEGRTGEWATLHEQKLTGAVARAVLLEDPARILFGMDHGICALEPKSEGFELILLKPLEGTCIEDACGGDFNGDGFMEAAFLVRFPGGAAVAPQTRILFHGTAGDFTWIECSDAVALDSGEVNGAPGDELIVDRGRELMEVSWR
jgi:hypothetical protein